jgi:hypothetical protein
MNDMNMVTVQVADLESVLDWAFSSGAFNEDTANPEDVISLKRILDAVMASPSYQGICAELATEADFLIHEITGGQGGN